MLKITEPPCKFFILLIVFALIEERVGIQNLESGGQEVDINSECPSKCSHFQVHSQSGSHQLREQQEEFSDHLLHEGCVCSLQSLVHR